MTNIATDYDPVTYWNARGKVQQEDEHELGAMMGETMVEWIVRWGITGTGDEDEFLEVGSGYGRVYEFLRERGLVNLNNYWMCDISESHADICAERTGQAVAVWDGKTLPCDDRAFDWVISANVLLHVPPADLDGHLCELARVSRKNVFVSTYTGTGRRLAAHCFEHEYELAFERAGLAIVAYADFPQERQGMWLLSV